MANARSQQLLEQRRAARLLSSYGTKVRSLSPSNNSVATIARQTAASELNIKVSQYNNGQISNDDMRTFLQKMSDNASLSANDKLDVQNQLADFDVRIQGDKLTAAYKAAPDNSLQQYQAAKALSSFYTSRASGQQAGTPAQSQNLQDAADWEQRAAATQDSIKKTASQNLRYQQELKVNQTPSNSSERANAKADMWKQLYDQAAADGDTVSANKYAANYQAELTNAQELSTRESTTANKKQLSDFINSTLNDYHGGKISGDDAIAQLQQADQFAADSGDLSTQNRLQSLYLTISREVDKGITYSTNGGFGDKSKAAGGGSDFYLNPDGSLSIGGGGGGTVGATKGTGSTAKATGGKTVLGSGTGGKSSPGKTVPGTTLGGSGNKPMTLAELDLNYKNQLNEANKALVEGKIPADSKDPKTPSYKQFVMLAAKDRQITLQNVVKGLGELSASGNTKIAAKATAALKTYGTELKNVTAEYNGIRSGNLVLSMSNKDFTDASGLTVSRPQLGFVNKNTIPGAVDVGGVYYQPRKENVFFGLNDLKLAQAYVKNNPGSVIEQHANGYYINDADGKKVQTSILDVTDNNGNVVTYKSDPKYGYLPEAVDAKTTEMRKQLIKEADTATKNGQTYTPKLLDYNGVQNYNPKAPAGVTTGQVKTPAPNFAQQAIGAVGNVVKPVANAVEGAIKDVVQPISPVLPEQASGQSLGISPNLPLNLPHNTQSNPPVSQTVPQSVGQGVKTAVPAPLQLAAQPKNAIQQSQIKNVPIKAPPLPAAPAKPQISLNPVQYAQQAINNLKNLATKILPFKF